MNILAGIAAFVLAIVWRPPRPRRLGEGEHERLSHALAGLAGKAADHDTPSAAPRRQHAVAPAGGGGAVGLRGSNSFAARSACGDTCPVRLFSDGFMPDEVLWHPRHEAAQKSLAELIAQLRACASVRDGYEFQQTLLDHVLAVEGDRNAFSQAVKRMRAGKGPQPGAPEPPSGRDRALAETWQLEYGVCERVARQFRCVGDALAWRVFGFDRRHIIALCLNEPPGVMAGKEGLAAEREVVDRAYREHGQLAILHDLTNCLRIGDVTVFGDDGSHETVEVKSDSRRRSPAQHRRIKAAQEAIRSGAPLPGKDRKARLFDLDLPFRTHLDLLRLGTARAARDGIFAAKVPGKRVLLVSDFYGCNAQGWTQDGYQERLARQVSAARRRAGIGNGREWDVAATSLDSASRDPQRVPLAAYPLDPAFCARLIGDLAVFVVRTSGPDLADWVRDAGLNAEWVRPPGHGELAAGEVVMELHSTTSGPMYGTLRMELKRTLQMRRSALDRYLIEMVEQDTWIKGMRHMLTSPDGVGHPWPTYRGEDEVWI